MVPLKSIDADGYVKIEFAEHPKAHFGKVHEHILVMEHYLGGPLPRGVHVHHKNRVRDDNRIENLLLIRSAEYHRALHWAIDNHDHQMVTTIENLSAEFMEQLKFKYSHVHSVTKHIVEEYPKITARRNLKTGTIFVEFDDEILITPGGKEIPIDLNLFGESEDVSESALTDQQMAVYRNKVRARIEAAADDKRINQLQYQLFLELKAERLKIARSKNVPAYVIFDDKTLKDITTVMPDNKFAMMQVNGVGPEKYRQYGETFLGVVLKFRQAHVAAKSGSAS